MVLVARKKVKTALGKSNLPGLDYTLNPYIGCSHSCVYCYARLYSKIEWGKVVVVKENIASILQEEAKKFKRGVVGLSTITDPYQHLEEKENLTRRLLIILLDNDFKVSIQTKSPLVLRDLDILQQRKDLVDVGITITTLNEKKAKIVEPFAPSPKKRAEALEKLSEEGIKTWIFLGPILPNFADSEDEIKEIVELAKATNSLLYYDRYRIKSFMKSGIAKELAENAKIRNWSEVESMIRRLCLKLDVECVSAF